MVLRSATIGWSGNRACSASTAVAALREEQRRAGLEPVDAGIDGNLRHVECLVEAGEVERNLDDRSGQRLQIHAARQDITVRSGVGRAFFNVAVPPSHALEMERDMRHTYLLGCLVAGCLVAGCTRPDPAPEAAGGGGSAAQDPKAGVVSLADLEREAAAIVQLSRTERAAAPEAADPKGPTAPIAAIDRKAPPYAAAHPKVSETTMTLVTASAPRQKRETPKAAVEGGSPVGPPKAWRALGYAGASFEPQRGVDAALLAPSDRAKGRGYTYAFLVLSEQLSDPLEKELQGLGVQLLGPHDGSQKARVPTDLARLRAIAAVSGVEAIAYARKDQKVERAARTPPPATPDSCRACRSSSARSTRRRSRSCGAGSPRPRRPSAASMPCCSRSRPSCRASASTSSPGSTPCSTSS